MEIVADHANNENSCLWTWLTKNMVLLEHFSVGVNRKVYDASTVNSMAGNFMIELKNGLNLIIAEKQGQENGAKNYKEFETMVEEIEKIRQCI